LITAKAEKIGGVTGAEPPLRGWSANTPARHATWVAEAANSGWSEGETSPT